MSMNVSVVIKWMMAVLGNLLKNGWKFRISDKFVDGVLTLEDDGFCVTVCGVKTIFSPIYVIDLFVRSFYVNQEDFVYYSWKSLFEIDSRLTAKHVSEAPSWVKIVYYLTRITESKNNCIDINYILLKDYLLSCGGNNEIVNTLLSMNCSELANIKNNKGLTKRIECLYYLEAYLIEYLVEEISDEIEIGDLEKVSNSIDLVDYNVDLVTFFKIIKTRNDYNVLDNDIKWLQNMYYRRAEKKNSVLGMDSDLLPSSLEAKVAFDNLILRKKEDLK